MIRQNKIGFKIGCIIKN